MIEAECRTEVFRALSAAAEENEYEEELASMTLEELVNDMIAYDDDVSKFPREWIKSSASEWRAGRGLSPDGRIQG